MGQSIRESISTGESIRESESVKLYRWIDGFQRIAARFGDPSVNPRHPILEKQSIRESGSADTDSGSFIRGALYPTTSVEPN